MERSPSKSRASNSEYNLELTQNKGMDGFTEFKPLFNSLKFIGAYDLSAENCKDNCVGKQAQSIRRLIIDNLWLSWHYTVVGLLSFFMISQYISTCMALAKVMSSPSESHNSISSNESASSTANADLVLLIQLITDSLRFTHIWLRATSVHHQREQYHGLLSEIQGSTSLLPRCRWSESKFTKVTIFIWFYCCV